MLMIIITTSNSAKVVGSGVTETPGTFNAFTSDAICVHTFEYLV